MQMSSSKKVTLLVFASRLSFPNFGTNAPIITVMQNRHEVRSHNNIGNKGRLAHYLCLSAPRSKLNCTNCPSDILKHVRTSCGAVPTLCLHFHFTFSFPSSSSVKDESIFPLFTVDCQNFFVNLFSYVSSN